MDIHGAYWKHSGWRACSIIFCVVGNIFCSNMCVESYTWVIC